MRKNKLFRIGIIAIAAVMLISFTDKYYFKINKSFDVFGSLFKEVANNYVLDVDPEILMKSGIEGMLNSLDPYSVFYTEEDNEEIEMITDGSYVGFGITVSVVDSMLTIVDIYEGFSAHQNGLRIGDRIFMVDSARVLNHSADYLRQFTKGAPGEVVDVKIFRDGRDDTLRFLMERDQIKIDDVSYAAMLDNDIGYIKLEHFSNNSAEAFLQSMNKLKSENGKLSGLIIDLRDNPGGLLTAAVSICEYFVDEGSKIVSTKGRNKHNGFTYRSLSTPIEPDLPLAVLINENSASASEIVAGAIQDLDRGVIIGRRSFGKGLVQSLYDLPYNTILKLTTAKYYTPSGRCIQRLTFAEDYGGKQVEVSKDTNVFYTRNGRKVFELTGIQPDSVVGPIEYPDIVIDILRKHLVFNYANLFTSKLDYIEDGFRVDDKIFADFKNYIFDEYSFGLTEADEHLMEIDRIADNNKYNKQLKERIESLRKALTKEQLAQIDNNADMLKEILEDEILRRFYPQSYMLKKSLEQDESITVAQKLLMPARYNSILAKEKQAEPGNKNQNN